MPIPYIYGRMAIPSMFYHVPYERKHLQIHLGVFFSMSEITHRVKNRPEVGHHQLTAARRKMVPISASEWNEKLGLTAEDYYSSTE